jgi:conjugal transfer/entry exclusion protein
MAAHFATAERLKSALSEFIDSKSKEVADLSSRVDELTVAAAHIEALQQLVAQHASQLASVEKLTAQREILLSELQQTVL